MKPSGLACLAAMIMAAVAFLVFPAGDHLPREIRSLYGAACAAFLMALAAFLRAGEPR